MKKNNKGGIYLTPKKIKKNSIHKLTNADIKANYKDAKFYINLNDLRGAFACWVVRLLEEPNYSLISKSLKAYTNYLVKNHFKQQDVPIEMTYKQIEEITSEKVFISIPEIFALNKIEGGKYVDLGALSRNVFYHILREAITQPL